MARGRNLELLTQVQMGSTHMRYSEYQDLGHQGLPLRNLNLKICHIISEIASWRERVLRLSETSEGWDWVFYGGVCDWRVLL